jgi:hypothetical protein
MPQPFDAVNRLAQAVMKPVYGRHILQKLADASPPQPRDEPAVAGGA